MLSQISHLNYKQSLERNNMPAFIKNPKDEAKWKKAKDAAEKTLSEGDGDGFWALTNSIYQKMNKIKEEFEKARNPSDEDNSDEDLTENNHEYNQGDNYEEYDQGEDEEAHQRGIEEDLGNDGESQDVGEIPEETEVAGQGDRPTKSPQASIRPEDEPEKVAGKKSRFRQPSKEDIAGMRAYTRPWEQRARETSRLKADPAKNPVLAQQGNIIETRNKWHGDRKGAYQKLTTSDGYKNADPVTQMEMDDNFEKEWHSKNPEHLNAAMNAHGQTHEKGKEAKDIHAAAKDAKIRNIIEGGAQGGGETFSTEAGLQHAGGTKGEEGTQGTIIQDPAASFAMGNKDFVKQYGQDYNKKAKKVGNIDDMMDYNDDDKRDIGRILGSGPDKDPKFEEFFSHYHPLIGMSAHKTINKLGLDPKNVDMSLLHEAGMHGLVQAINDYDHDHPSKASFSTHAGNKIRGLQQTAMKNQDAIPAEVRQAQKKFSNAPAAPAVPKVDTHAVISNSKHPAAADMADRLKRVSTAKTTMIARKSSAKPIQTAAAPKQLANPIGFDPMLDEEEQD